MWREVRLQSCYCGLVGEELPELPEPKPEEGLDPEGEPKPDEVGLVDEPEPNPDEGEPTPDEGEPNPDGEEDEPDPEPNPVPTPPPIRAALAFICSIRGS